MNSAYWLIFICLWAHPLLASTFVGNGGNAGEIDLRIAIKAVHETVSDLDESFVEICVCEGESRAGGLCSVLDQLTDEQAKFCEETYLQTRGILQILTAKKSTIVYKWSSESLSVLDGDGKKRPVDAVALVEKKVIVLDRERFLDLSAPRRRALLVHEYLHFAKVGDKVFSDEDPIGPFESGEGLRDAIGAAVALAGSVTAAANTLEGSASISRGNKHFWIKLQTDIPKRSDETRRLLLFPENYTDAVAINVAAGVKYKRLGLQLVSTSQVNEAKSVRSIKVEEAILLAGIGISYDFYPIEATDALKWNEFHIAPTILYYHGLADYKAWDDTVTIRDNGNVKGEKATVDLYFPLASGFWFLLEGGGRALQYEYKSLGIKIEEKETIFGWGFAYGF